MGQYYQEVYSVWSTGIGSTGLVFQRPLQSLMDCGMPEKQAKGVCKWMFNSNIITARDIWSKRCRLVKEHRVGRLLFLTKSFNKHPYVLCVYVCILDHNQICIHGHL